MAGDHPEYALAVQLSVGRQASSNEGLFRSCLEALIPLIVLQRDHLTLVRGRP